MIKIAFIIPTLDNGGAERVVSNLLLNLDKNYEKYLILFDGEKIVYPYKGKLIDLKTFNSKGVFRFLNYFFAYFKLKKIKKKYKFDVVISFLEIPSFLNLLTKDKEKTIISVRNYTSKAFRGLRAKIYFPLIRKLYNFSDKIISVSKETKKDLVNFFGIDKEKIEVIYNFYDLEKIQKLADEVLDEEYINIFEKKVIINTGRLIYQKGQTLLLEAFSRIKNRNEYNLIILGEGYLEGELKEQAKCLDIEKNVYFLGFQKNPFKFLKKADMFVFPSRFEGFPNALAEAMACGLPVIANDCPSGPKEILEDQYGLLVKNIDDEEKVISKLVEYMEILDNEYIKMKYRKKSLERIKAFKKENIIKNWEKIIKNI